MSERLRVLGIPGSLRRESYNRSLLDAAAGLAEADVRLVVYDALAAVPLFSEDLEHGGGPAGVRDLRRAVRSADAVLFATPEYNQSIPGVLKNAIDWLSRSDVLEGKPVAVIGATTGPWGTRLAQAELRHVLTVCGAAVLPAPMVYLSHAMARFDADGRLVDADACDRLAAVVARLADWVRRLTGVLGHQPNGDHHPAAASTRAVDS